MLKSDDDELDVHFSRLRWTGAGEHHSKYLNIQNKIGKKFSESRDNP